MDIQFKTIQHIQVSTIVLQCSRTKSLYIQVCRYPFPFVCSMSLYTLCWFVSCHFAFEKDLAKIESAGPLPIDIEQIITQIVYQY